MDKIKIGFIGTGGIANAHLDNLARMKDVEITALCDVVKEKAEAASQKFGGKVYLDYRRMLDKEKLDALYICVPPFAHQDQELIACQKKIPFFVEKPVALSLEKAEKIEAQVRKSGIITSVGYVLRYMDIVEKTVKILAGRPTGMITGSYYGEVPGTKWLIKKNQSGGQLVEQATHIVNLMLFFGGKVLEVYSRPFSGIISKRIPGYNVEDASTTIFRFANGAIGNINCTWLSFGYKSSLGIVTDGIQVDWNPITTLQVTTADKKEEHAVKNDFGFSEHRVFVDAVKTGNKKLIRCDYSNGLETLKVTRAAVKSMETGKPVKL
ncbi:MAG: Gfo/Idh/MocA family oxidoreductase [Candidatus Omnitrophica bacterium]|nr:Gfo/Idh/MocA family oxidoreductase [Candidatus Omnitrophota bacterium]